MSRSPSEIFSIAAQWTAHKCGRPIAFGVACGLIVIWGLSGPLFHFSDTWQLVINTGTTIITFLMVFLLQNTQNRDTNALQLKLDELIRVNDFARNQLLTLENLTEDEMERLKKSFAQIADGDHLHDVKAGLEQAGEGIAQATEKVSEVESKIAE